MKVIFELMCWQRQLLYHLLKPVYNLCAGVVFERFSIMWNFIEQKEHNSANRDHANKNEECMGAVTPDRDAENVLI
jgi:hypothetical protein